MTDYSTTTALMPGAAPRNPGMSEAYDDATDRDSATPTEHAGAHKNAADNEMTAVYDWFFKVATELTIDGAGAITVTHGHHTVDTAGDAGTDNLDTINGGAAGKRVRIRAAHADRTVVIRNGQDNVLTGGSNVELDDTDKWVELEYDVPLTAWLIVGGAGGGDQTPWASTIDAADNALEDLGRLNYTAASELTIAAGAITATETVHTVDTAGDAAIDDLDTINGGTEGDVLILLPEDAARTVWITDAGNIDTPNGRHYPIPEVGARLYFHGATWLLQSCGDWMLVEDYTVTLTAAMSAATIQGHIDSVPRNLGGHTVIFQFADGSYTLSTELEFAYFYVGIIDIQGNDGESGLHTNQAAILDFGGQVVDGLNIHDNYATTRVFNLNIEIKTDGALSIAVRIDIGLKAFISGCYLHGNSITNGIGGFGSYLGGITFETTYVSNMLDGFRSFISRMFSNGNDDTGAQTAYGLRAGAAALIGKTGTQPTGATADETVSGGGEIR